MRNLSETSVNITPMKTLAAKILAADGKFLTSVEIKPEDLGYDRCHSFKNEIMLRRLMIDYAISAIGAGVMGQYNLLSGNSIFAFGRFDSFFRAASAHEINLDFKDISEIMKNKHGVEEFVIPAMDDSFLASISGGGNILLEKIDYKFSNPIRTSRLHITLNIQRCEDQQKNDFIKMMSEINANEPYPADDELHRLTDNVFFFVMTKQIHVLNFINIDKISLRKLCLLGEVEFMEDKLCLFPGGNRGKPVRLPFGIRNSNQ